MSVLQRVFVYGTLKRGEPNHHWFNKCEKGSYKFLGEAKTTEKYPLIIATKYNIPFLLYQPGTGYNVQGELYEVCAETLRQLDILEDHPHFYVRETKQVMLPNNSQITDAWIYFLKKFDPQILNKQMFQSYSSKGDHGLVYLERYLRDSTHDYRSEVMSE